MDGLRVFAEYVLPVLLLALSGWERIHHPEWAAGARDAL